MAARSLGAGNRLNVLEWGLDNAVANDAACTRWRGPAAHARAQAEPSLQHLFPVKDPRLDGEDIYAKLLRSFKV